MNLSKELQGQLDRLSKTGSFSISMTLKKELQELTVQIGCNKLVNMDCGSCVRKSMHDVNHYFNGLKTKPVLQKMSFEKKPDEMTYKEMRRFAKSKGHRLKNPTKEQLIKIISSEN